MVGLRNTWNYVADRVRKLFLARGGLMVSSALLLSSPVQLVLSEAEASLTSSFCNSVQHLRRLY